jgi:YggT family protein
VSTIATIVYYLLLIYFFVLWARLVLDLIQMFNRGWRPAGGMLVVAEVVFTVTDPPIRAVRRVLPPVRMGSVALDFAFSVVMLVVIVLMTIFGALRFS